MKNNCAKTIFSEKSPKLTKFWQYCYFLPVLAGRGEFNFLLRKNTGNEKDLKKSGDENPDFSLEYSPHNPSVKFK